ncbi:MAG: phosphoribosylglycinamide formyltransferase [Nitrospirota bacterium]|nr:phosphoribosylglycinamide formyltransferase [Nitrospirota bacterium]
MSDGLRTGVVVLGVLASGSGTNLQAIIDNIETGRLSAQIAVVISDKANAYALDRAKKHGIPTLFLNPADHAGRSAYNKKIAEELAKHGVELVILAGFMRIVTRELIEPFCNRIMNIHPALLPAFPGLHGQKQALDHGVKVAGATVHFVDEGMDTGPIIAQAAVPVLEDDTEETLSARILEQEHILYSRAIRLFAEGKLEIAGRQVKVKKTD